MSVYKLKPAFQQLLRPGVATLYRWGVTANQVTLFACLVSVLLGVALFVLAPAAWVFVLVPVWLLLRMVCNAVDGMLAREFDQQSALGAMLNELTDVVSDAALYLPFVWVLPGSPFWLGLVIVLAGLAEFAGALGPTVGGSRRYDGPMGKSDRAVVFGALGLLVALGWPLPWWLTILMPLLAILIALTIVRRVRLALKEGATSSSACY